jgi:hypothetical protein
MKNWEAFMQGGAGQAELKVDEAGEDGRPERLPGTLGVGVYPASETLAAGFGAQSVMGDA